MGDVELIEGSPQLFIHITGKVESASGIEEGANVVGMIEVPFQESNVEFPLAQRFIERSSFDGDNLDLDAKLFELIDESVTDVVVLRLAVVGDDEPQCFLGRLGVGNEKAPGLCSRS